MEIGNDLQKALSNITVIKLQYVFLYKNIIFDGLR